jgi:oligopeptide/dipeptide ABC transporter ATP-binding protein
VLLSIEQLRTYYYTNQGIVKAVDGVNLSLSRGEIIAIVGESGSGKSTLGLSIVRLLPESARIEGGKIIYDGIGDLVSLPDRDMRHIRGRKIGMVFQNPRAYLNPVMKIGDQVSEGMIANLGFSKDKAMDESIVLLEKVGLASPQTRVHQYPHELSGGMQQRVLLAIALASHPEILIADEPTTALDTITQAQIIKLLQGIVRERKMSLIFITHDIELALVFADKVCIMYGGTMFEVGPRQEIAKRPRNPYTMALLRSLPTPRIKGKHLESIPGAPPNLLELPSGCVFNPRCPYSQEICTQKRPDLTSVGGNHFSACHFAESIGGVSID